MFSKLTKFLTFSVIQLGGSNPEEFVSLIIVASTSRIAVFDLAHSDLILLESGLKELLEDTKVLKVCLKMLINLHSFYVSLLI